MKNGSKSRSSLLENPPPRFFAARYNALPPRQLCVKRRVCSALIPVRTRLCHPSDKGIQTQVRSALFHGSCAPPPGASAKKRPEDVFQPHPVRAYTPPEAFFTFADIHVPYGRLSPRLSAIFPPLFRRCSKTAPPGAVATLADASILRPRLTVWGGGSILVRNGHTVAVAAR